MLSLNDPVCFKTKGFTEHWHSQGGAGERAHLGSTPKPAKSANFYPFLPFPHPGSAHFYLFTISAPRGHAILATRMLKDPLYI